MKRALMVVTPLWGLFYCKERLVRKCQEKQSTPATTPDARTLQRVGSVSNTRRKRTSVTRSTTVTPLRGDGMEERGNASVTAMLRPTPSVRSVTRRECWYLLKRYTTSYRCPRVEHMTGITWWLFVRVVTQGSMPSEETGGTTIVKPNRYKMHPNR